MMNHPFVIVYTPRFKEHNTGEHPENAKRMDAATAALRQSPALQSVRWIEPRAATKEELALVHTEKHIQAMKTLAESGGGHADADTVLSPASFETARLSAGALLAALDGIGGNEFSRAFVLGRPPGHHALPGKAMGFCIFNNISIAAQYARQKLGYQRVLILDWDVHHGNGTQEIFYEDDTVFYISTHQYPHYPGTGAASERGRGRGEGFTRNLPFPAHTDPEKIVEAVTEALREIVPRFKPDLFLISAGFDGHKDDPLGNWLLLESHFIRFTDLVVGYAKQYAGGKIVSCLEGGYNLNMMAASCAAHCQALAE